MRRMSKRAPGTPGICGLWFRSPTCAMGPSSIVAPGSPDRIRCTTVSSAKADSSPRRSFSISSATSGTPSRLAHLTGGDYAQRRLCSSDLTTGMSAMDLYPLGAQDLFRKVKSANNRVGRQRELVAAPTLVFHVLSAFAEGVSATAASEVSSRNVNVSCR